jgi:formylglycine-generating enzyme
MNGVRDGVLTLDGAMSTHSDAPACCAPPAAARTPAPAPEALTPDPTAATRARREMVALPGGTFAMGSEDADVNAGDAEGPVRPVEVAPFLISPVAVTNARFAGFVKRTGYRTSAERWGWSYVFHAFVGEEARRHVRGTSDSAPWWVAVDGADWRHPDGPGSTITDRRNHPVVHLSHDDARAYCAWIGARLPSEAEWEYAARGGLAGARYPWGDELTPGGRHRCNIWQGRFPVQDTAEDGYAGTCPVTAYRPNGYGLHNLVGNVWEWTADPWSAADPDSGFAMRGGSYLCHESYCNRYRVAARTHNTGDSSAGNLGLRCAADVEA